MQNLFGGRFNVQGALPSGAPVRAEDRANINKGVTEMRNFHLGRIEAVINQANVEFRGGVLSREQMRDALIAGTINAAQISVWLSRIFTLGGHADMGNQIQNFIAGPIVDAIGWPRNPDGSPKLRLTREEADTIMTKLGSLNETVQAFRKGNGNERIHSAISALRAINPAEAVSAARIGRVREPLPAGDVSAEQVPNRLTALEREYGNREDAVATMHAMLLRQLHGSWGALNPDGRSGTGFIGAYASMLTEIERIIGVQLDVAGACFQMSKNMFDMAKYLAYAGAAAGIAPYIVGTGALSLGLGVARRGVGLTWRTVQWMRSPRISAPAAGSPSSGSAPLRATPFQRAFWLGGMGYEAYRLYNTYQDLGRENERLNDVKGAIAAQLVLAGFVRQDGDVYTHSCGSRIRLNEMHEQLDQQRYALYARGGVQAIGLGAALLMGPRVFAGPAGWTLIGIQIVVESGITAWENQAARRLLANPNTPPWLLAALGTSALVNRSEYDMLVNSSSWNFIFGSSEEEKDTVRKKTYFAIFNQELGAASPELLREITAGSRNVGEIDAIYTGDFQSMLIPYLYVRLFQRARARNSSVPWSSVNEGRVDRGYVVFPADVTNVDIRAAMRELGVLYVQHLREKRYVDLLERREKLTADLAANPGDRTKQAQLSDIHHVLQSMGQDMVLGVRLSTLTLEQARGNAGKTRTQTMMEALYSQVNGNAATPSFRLTAEGMAGIRGLPEALAKGGMDFSSDTNTLRFADDDAQRTNLQRIGPLSTDEPEGRIFPQWNDWSGNVRRLLDFPIGVDEATVVHGHRLVAGNISQAAGMPPLAGNASSEAARDRMTEGAISIFGVAGRRCMRDNNLQRHVYGSRIGNVPLVFSDLNDGGIAANMARQRDLCRMVSIPDQAGPFAIEHVRAVFFEGKRMPSGHDVVLATFIYGDIQAMGIRNTRVYVLQQGAGSAATVGSNITARGRSIAYNEQAFQGQQGAARMLNDTLAGLFDEERAAALRRHEAAEREAKEKPIREKQESEKKERDRIEKEKIEKEREERMKRIKADIERARKTPNTLVLTQTPEGGSRYVMFYRDIAGDTERTIFIPRYNRPGPAGPAFEAAPNGSMRDPAHTCMLTISDGTREWTANIRWDFMATNDVAAVDKRMFLRILLALTDRQAEGMDRIIAMMPIIDRMGREQFRERFEKQFSSFSDKRICLFYLLALLGHRGGIRDNSVLDLFDRYQNIFAAASTEEDIERLLRGMNTFVGLGVNVNRDGVFTHNSDTARGVTPLHYRYVPGGWQWTPDLVNWMPVTTTTVSGGRYNGRSPTGPNVAFIESLPR